MSDNNLFKKKFKLLRKRAFHRAKIGLNYWLNRQVKKPVFIIASRRTGTNFLIDLLNSVPGVSFVPEILHSEMAYGIRRSFISKKTVLRHILHSIHACRDTICGTKFIFVQLEAHRITLENLNHLFPEAKFIILYRRSFFDQFVSLKIAELTDVWQTYGVFEPPRSFCIDPNELKSQYLKIKFFYEGIFKRSWLESRSIVLTYEDLYGDPQEIFNRMIFPFLKLPVSEVSWKIRKQNLRQAQEIVENFEDLKPLAEEMKQKYSFSRDELQEQLI